MSLISRRVWVEHKPPEATDWERLEKVPNEAKEADVNRIVKRIKAEAESGTRFRMVIETVETFGCVWEAE